MADKLTVRAKFIHTELHVNALLLLTITQALNGHKSIGHWADTYTVSTLTCSGSQICVIINIFKNTCVKQTMCCSGKRHTQPEQYIQGNQNKTESKL
jgi:hypothetical protein